MTDSNSHLWHPCTQMHDHEAFPPVAIRSGKGVWLEGFDGKRYLDAISSWWVNLFGHCHPYISAQVAEQLETLEHVLLAGFTHEPVIELSRRLATITPDGLNKVFFADNGSSAVEVALKMSYHYWRNQGQSGKRHFVSISGAYHGETLGALAVGDLGLYKETYQPLLMEALSVPGPDAFRAEPGESAEAFARRRFTAMDDLLAARHEEIAAVIIEPLVQCAAGMRMYHPVYLSLLREACNEYQVHLIADEIAVGFGRTGTLFACEEADIAPDFMCLSKGLTGGYLPLAAVVTTENVYQAFYDRYETLKGFLHSHSYTGNPLACRAALATLDLFEQRDVLADNAHLADHMRTCLEPLRDHPHVGDVRQTGMIAAVEMMANPASGVAYDWRERRGLRVFRHGLAEGVLLRPLGNVVYFMPPYVITEEEIELMVATAASGIEQATA